MSVAFTREDSAQTAQEVSLPERLISQHPNLVTQDGWRALEAAAAGSQVALATARRVEAADERRRAVELALRDLSYFSERLRSAEIVAAPTSLDVVAFGRRVAIARDDGRRQTYRIVGEDEADPSAGSISFVSPLARAMLGKTVGDVVEVGAREIEILAIA